MNCFSFTRASAELLATGRRCCLLLVLGLAGNAHALGPAFDCRAARGIIESLICEEPELITLDRRMAEVYAAAEPKASNEFPSVLRPEQRNWAKLRNECWKSEQRLECTRDAYRHRIAELQARYRLLEPNASVSYVCADQSRIAVSYFPTDPPTLLAQRNDETRLMLAQPAASGARYASREASLWEHQGKARVQWGYAAAEMECLPRN